MFLNQITENFYIDHAYTIQPKSFTEIYEIAKYIRITHALACFATLFYIGNTL